MPFYARLLAVVAGAPKGHVRLIFITHDDEYLASRSVPRGTPGDDIRADAPFPDWITGTPTIARVDQTGKVIQVWAGYLPNKEQEDLLRLVRSM